jgi:cob(I)alamin adenosyltransferase
MTESAEQIELSNERLVKELDDVLSHVWMVRTFLKHSEEAEEDDELRDVHRDLYDYMLALGAPLKSGDHAKYLKVARKKLKRLKAANELFTEIQPEISSHTNFQMAAQSLRLCVAKVIALLDG